MSNTNNQDLSISGLWRKNASRDPATDLASMIDAARIISKSLKPDTDVVFAGMKVANTDQKKIILSAAGLGEQHPIPGDVVDRKLGEVVHRIGHMIFAPEDTGRLRAQAGISWNDPDNASLLNSITDVFEDIQLDNLMTAYPGYHEYLRRERQANLAEYDLDMLTKPLQTQCDRIDMVNALVYLALSGGKLPQNINQENMQTLANVADLATKMIAHKMSKRDAIVAAYREIHKLPAHLNHDDDGTMQIPDTDQQSSVPQTQPDQEQSDDSSGSGQGEESDGQESGDQSDDKPEQQDGEAPDGSEESGDGEAEESGGQDDGAEQEEPEETGDTEPTSGNSEAQDPDEMEPDENGTGSGDGRTETDESEPAEPTESGDIEPEPEPEPEQPKFEQVNLASHLDDMVDDNTELDEKTANEVSDAVQNNSQDLSQLISYLAKDSNQTIMAYTPDEGADIVNEARQKTYNTEQKLRRVLQDFRLKRTRDYRGLRSGRVSSRRLYRVAYNDERVFQRRDHPDEINMAICLLFDLSGSMASYSDLIYQLVVAMSDAFSKEKVDFMAVGYSNQTGKVFIPRLYDREINKVKLDLNKEWGGTPSYEGIAAAVAQLQRLTGNKQKVIIHFTDGHPNSYNTGEISQLLRDARKQNIMDFHIYLGGMSGAAPDWFCNLYGQDAMALNDVSQAPDIIDKLIRRKLGI
jgi:von Willebrand factor type A domain